MARTRARGNVVWVVLLGALGVAAILTLGWVVWSRGVSAARAVADGGLPVAPSLPPAHLPQGPKLPDLPVPRPK